MDIEEKLYRTGKGHWNHFSLELEQIFEAAKKWKTKTEGYDKLWLCWNVDPDWCLVQQQLVKDAGWTPLVGSDPRAKAPVLLEGSIEIDFNEDLKLPMLHMMFPIEFAFLYAKKLAFWHSDLLVRNKNVSYLAEVFESLQEGDIAVTKPNRGIKNTILNKYNRYWELAGCTTQAASKHQFETGSGWFGHVAYHPNSPKAEFAKKSKIYYDHGSGIKYWAKNLKPKNSKVYLIPEKLLDEGHCTRIRSKHYVAQSPNNSRRNLALDLSYNFDLKTECQKLDLRDTYKKVLPK
ncbi:hypothetical protein GCM10009128_24340 [Psychrosphaera haliotis]|uniref:hypothetical protein n=1 Tax=Psychrosphaera haliotis TaxID=555083 RepID=UPI0031DA662A